jgi:hypothetical protein
MWDIVNTLLGWDHLTPQVVRFGLASFLALTVLAPGRPDSIRGLVQHAPHGRCCPFGRASDLTRR